MALVAVPRLGAGPGSPPMSFRETFDDDGAPRGSPTQERYVQQKLPLRFRYFWPGAASALFAAVSLILVIFAIIPGHSPGYMEDYHVVYFNTSTLGKSLLNDTSLKVRSAAMPQITEPPNLLRRYHAAPAKRFGVSDLTSDIGKGAGAATSAAAEAATAAGSVATEAASVVESAASAATSGLAHLVDEAKEELEKIEDDLADELYSKLNIQQWYSVHLLDLCYGNFTPNATSAGASFNTTNCTTPADYTKILNFSSILNQSLSVGPYQLDLSDIGLVQDAVDGINDAMKVLADCLRAILAMYIISAFFGLLSVGFSIWSIFAIKITGEMSHRTKQLAIYGNLGFAFASCLFLFIGSLVTTLGGKKVVEEVRAHGAAYGLAAYRGGGFLALSWAAFALIVIVTAFWTFAWADAIRSRRRTRKATARAQEKLGY
ncbi:hypothetical protein M406DRAFT_332140 [Cryphonectria parasitica EP155]|uniref:SUR7 protein n=1 Tax=Cryphonectria parasitica (strain ATCC 38755 / EP155) TaxID=660469 RepID=A0A9P4XZB6_CRYP1|nr:uncharacterized protein M406DRAFT_332140 [Cryphonectria parasitica EP155]KAF3763676.1 hypothetical protein M406DRAFT_332140 [Cryphonectria parasitica EP155]